MACLGWLWFAQLMVDLPGLGLLIGLCLTDVDLLAHAAREERAGNG